jgi:transposase
LHWLSNNLKTNARCDEWSAALVDIPKGITLVGVPPMQQRKRHPDSFKKDAVRRVMARGTKTVAEVAKDLGVSPSMLHRWREQLEPELSGTAPASQSEREEIERLRRELRDVQAENSLLKKAAALFAKDVK